MLMLQLGFMQIKDVKKYLRSSDSNQWWLFLPKLAPTPLARMPSSEGRAHGCRQDQAIPPCLLSRFFSEPEMTGWSSGPPFFTQPTKSISSHTQENNMKTRRDKIECKKTPTPKRSQKYQWRIHRVGSQIESSDPKSKKLVKPQEPFWGLENGSHFCEFHPL